MSLTDYVIMPGADYQDACDAIREKTGGTEMIKSGEMGGLIRGIISGIPKTVTQYGDEAVTEIVANAFQGYTSLVSVYYPNVTYINSNAFYKCTALKEAKFPSATLIQGSAFRSCSALIEAIFPVASIFSGNIFQYCTALKTVDLPAATRVGSYTFDGCSSLESVNLPELQQTTSVVVYGTFRKCTSLKRINLPKVIVVDEAMFDGCTSLMQADFAAVTSIGSSAFNNCSSLTALIIRHTNRVTLASTTVFRNTPIASGTGYIYVPASIINNYKSQNYWSTYASQFRALEDYTVDGTTTGALDETKI